MGTRVFYLAGKVEGPAQSRAEGAARRMLAAPTDSVADAPSLQPHCAMQQVTGRRARGSQVVVALGQAKEPGQHGEGRRRGCGSGRVAVCTCSARGSRKAGGGRARRPRRVALEGPTEEPVNHTHRWTYRRRTACRWRHRRRRQLHHAHTTHHTPRLSLSRKREGLRL